MSGGSAVKVERAGCNGFLVCGSLLRVEIPRAHA
jgi:hypothetical protein